MTVQFPPPEVRAFGAPGLAQVVPVQPDPAAWTRCLSRLQPQAQQAGVSAQTWGTLFNGIQPDATVLEKLDNQPEFKTPIWDYLAGWVDEERVAEGQRLMAQHATTLEHVATAYGVDAATVVAVWGVESNFGQSFGRYPLVQALGTLSCFGRRQAFFQKELYATLRISQGGHVAPQAPQLLTSLVMRVLQPPAAASTNEQVRYSS